jgi:sulfhydrogenase subunit delta
MVKKKAPKNKITARKKTVRKKAVKKKIVSSKEIKAVPNKAVSSEKETKKKPKIAIVSLTSCEGCQFVLLDLGQRFLDLANQVEMVDFRLLEDEEDSGLSLDLVLVEGNPVTEDNLKLLRKVRERARILVAMGNCAAMGGIPEMKNYQEGANTIKHVYKYIHGIKNPPIREIDNFVKVDFTFPGCPINGEEFLKYIPELIAGRVPQIPDQPVCVECKKKGNRCFLLDKKPCFGPMILGGCDAVCPTARMTCQGCRGLRPGGNVAAMRNTLKTMMTDEEFENTSEIYGLRDDIEGRK